MKRLIKFVLALMVFSCISGCSASKKTYQEMRGLMLLENTQIGRNKVYYSKQNIKKMKTAYRKYHRNNSFR
jgi:hypothetical protein